MKRILLPSLLILAALSVPVSAFAEAADESSGAVGNVYFSIFDGDLYGIGMQGGGEYIHPETKAGAGIRAGYGMFMGSKGNEDPDDDLRLAMTGNLDVYGTVRIFPWMAGYAGVGALALFESFSMVVPVGRSVYDADVTTKGLPIMPSVFAGVRARLNEDNLHLFFEWRYERDDVT